MNIRALSVSACVAIFAVAGIGVSTAAAKPHKCVPHVPSKGDVLVSGGEGVGPAFDETGATEFYSVAAGQWLSACPTRVEHDEAGIAVDGGNLLVIGGEILKTDKKHDHLITRNSDLYVSSTGKFKRGSTLRKPLEDFAVVTLADGRILVIGGTTGNDTETAEATVELLAPPAAAWKLLKQKMTVARSRAGAARMTAGPKSGQVLIAGGTSQAFEDSPFLGSAELFDPSSSTFTATGGNMTVQRANPVLTALPDGTVLITGGYDNNFDSLASAEIYNPATDDFTATAGNMNVARADHTATLLPNGTVLIAGGEADFNNGNNFIALNSAEIYDPAKGTFTLVPNTMSDARDDATATLIAGTGTNLDGMVLIASGFNQNSTSTSADLYNPSNQTFTATGAMNFAHGHGVAAQIP